ncbi:hypothetical protein [Bradyrhizobium elkanii]|uniref:hypothetical protein n=1 Tax=Bradyrhizobium elkanii TaxID=29448 RepID=UPI00056DD4CB|nr:hypothetical protein [Bradyrhizobium elkanii]
MTDRNEAATELHRRAVLAGLAAAAPAAALASVPALSAQASVMSPDDPVFGLIEAHRAVARAAAAASEERSRRQQILLDEGIGLRPHVTAIDDSGSPVVVYSHRHIDGCPTLSGQQRDRAHAGLEAALGRHSAVLGDIDNVVSDACDAADEHLDALLSTAPTSVAGLRALLHYILADDGGPTCDEDLSWNGRLETLLFSIVGALDNIDAAHAGEAV